MLLTLAAAALDNADRVARGYEAHPQTYSLGMLAAGIFALSTVVVSLFWWGASGRASLNAQALRREIERSQDYRRERDEMREQYERLRRESMLDLTKYLLVGESLARLYDDLKVGKVPKPKRETPP